MSPGEGHGKSPVGADAGQKRASAGGSDGATESPSRKRRPYTSIACEECKRRKVKCSGESPCQRCRHSTIPCVYGRETREAEAYYTPGESRVAQLNATILELQRQVADLSSKLQAGHATSGNAIEGHASEYSSTLPQPQHPSPAHSILSPINSTNVLRDRRPSGPTSTNFYLDFAGKALGNSIDKPDRTERVSIATTISSSSSHAPDSLRTEPKRARQKLLPTLTFGEMQRMIGVYEAEVGIQYPFLDLDGLNRYIRQTYPEPFAQSEGRPSQRQISLKDDGEMEEILIAIFAIAKVLDEQGQTESGALWIDRVLSIARRALDRQDVKVHDLVLLTLISVYHFENDQELLAWRNISLVMKMCEEMGLHRQTNLEQSFKDSQERFWVVRLFWCVYVMNRRFGFGCGLSFALQDSDIDSDLQRPDDGTPYLRAMILYSHLASRVREFTTKNVTVADLDLEETRGYLCFQLGQWRRSLSSSLQFQGLGDDFNQQNQDRGSYRLRLLLFLRFNQMRMLINRSLIPTTRRPLANNLGVAECVEAAQSSIRVLKRLNEATDIYQSQQMCFNHFLHAAFAVLLIAVTYDPVSFLQTCARDINMALDIIRTLSMKSTISKRLWESVKVFRNFESWLRQPTQGAQNGHSSSAVAGREPEIDQGPNDLIPTSTTGQPRHRRTVMTGYDHLFRSSPVDLPDTPQAMNQTQQKLGQQNNPEFLTSLSEHAIREPPRPNLAPTTDTEDVNNSSRGNASFNLDFLNFRDNNNNSSSSNNNNNGGGGVNNDNWFLQSTSAVDFPDLGELPTFGEIGWDMFTF